MESLITQYGGIAGVVTMVIGIIYAIISALDKRSRKLRKTQSDTADNVIDLLKEEIQALGTKVAKQDVDIKALTVTVNELQAKNKTLLDVLQGRDETTQKFYKDAYSAIEIIKHNDKVSEDNSKILSKIATLLETVVNLKK